MKTALKWFPAVFATAMILSWLCTTIAGVFGLELPPQNVVLALFSPNVVLWKKLVIGAQVLAAPLLEEPIFRWLLHRHVCRRFMPYWLAITVSSCVFAAAHLNAVTFVPLAFLGFAFARLYDKTGSLWSSITEHFLFNLCNLILCAVCFILGIQM